MTPEEKFTEYINNHKNLILKISSIYCWNKDDRQDLFQEIVLQLWKSFAKFNNSYAFSTWAYRIALNVSISYVRNTTIRNKDIQHYKDSIRLDYSEIDGENENLLKLYNALKVLKPLDKAIISLNLEGCNNQEISKILGITTSNVSTRISRIKDRLKQNLIK